VSTIVSDITRSIKVEISRKECILERSHVQTLDNTIKYLQSESKKKKVYPPPEGSLSSRYALYSYERNLFHLALFDNNYESLQSNFRVIAAQLAHCVKKKKVISLRKMNVRNNFNTLILSFSFSPSFFAIRIFQTIYCRNSKDTFQKNHIFSAIIFSCIIVNTCIDTQ